jgi:hypothetical protein
MGVMKSRQQARKDVLKRKSTKRLNNVKAAKFSPGASAGAA